MTLPFWPCATSMGEIQEQKNSKHLAKHLKACRAATRQPGRLQAQKTKTIARTNVEPSKGDDRPRRSQCRPAWLAQNNIDLALRGATGDKADACNISYCTDHFAAEHVGKCTLERKCFLFDFFR